MTAPPTREATLEAVLAERGALGAAALDLLRPVAAALDDLHDVGAVHRDVRPGTIAVTSRGKGVLQPPAPPSTCSATVTGGRTDEPVWTAPEQVMSGVVSHRTDLYALACVAFAAMAGSPAFTVASAAEQAAGTVPSAADRNPLLPRAVDEAFRRALAVEPTERPASAHDLLVALEAALTGHSPRARARSRRMLRAVVAVVVAAVVVAAAVAAVVLLRPTDTAPAAGDPATRYALLAAPVPVGPQPLDVEAGEGALWVSGSADGSVTHIDPVTGATERFDVGGEPGQIVVAGGAVWVRNLGDRIIRIDTATGEVSAPIPGGGGPISGMAVAGGQVWLSHRDAGTVSRVDARTLELVRSPVPVGTDPAAMEAGANWVYVLNTGDGTLTRLDITTGAVGGTVQVGDNLGGIEVEDGTVYVAADGGVVPVPEDTFTPGEPYRFEGWSYFEVTGSTMWVVHDEDPRIQRFDVRSRQPVGEPVPGIGAEVGRARFAFDRLWMTLPDQNAVTALVPQP